MYLLFDIGGTKMRVVTAEGVIFAEVKNFDTPKNFDDVFGLLTPFKGQKITAVVVGLPGVLDQEKHSLVRAPNLPEWVGQPIKKKLHEFFDTEVCLENDAALAGLGEACFGAGKDYKIVAYLTVSTGIGGVRIVEKEIDANKWGFEPGHQIIDADVTIWPESKNYNPEVLTYGSISSYISGAAISVRYGKAPFKIKDSQVWKEVEGLLAVALNNTIVYWSPDVVVLGGGMILEDAISIENVRNLLKKSFKIFPGLPEVVRAELGDKSGLYGALKTIDKLKL